jgi:hypothetical protein
MTRTGKIALLPRPLRDELNRRLAQTAPGRVLVAWLNSLPEVQSLLESRFRSEPINEQNLSNWRRGGFTEWRHREDFLAGLRDIAEDAASLEATVGSLTDHAARLLALHFSRFLCPAETVRGQELTAPGLSGPQIKLLCEMTRAISSLRRGDQAAARLQLPQHRSRSPNPDPASTPAPAPAPIPSKETANTVAESFTLPPAIKPSQAQSSLSNSAVPESAPEFSAGPGPAIHGAATFLSPLAPARSATLFVPSRPLFIQAPPISPLIDDQPVPVPGKS